MKFFDHPDHAGPGMRESRWDRRRMKGGDGGASQMRADESARHKGAGGRGRHQRAVRRPQRQAMYTDIGGATRDVATTDLDKQFSQASKQNLSAWRALGCWVGPWTPRPAPILRSGMARANQGRASRRPEPLPISSRWTKERPARTLISPGESGLDTGTAAQLAAGQSAAAAETAGQRCRDDGGPAVVPPRPSLPAEQGAGGAVSEWTAAAAGRWGFVNSLFGGKPYVGRSTELRGAAWIRSASP